MAAKSKTLTPGELKHLPAPAKRALKAGLSADEAHFVAAYVDSGGKVSQAAKLIGRHLSTARTLFNKPVVRAAIVAEIEFRAAGDAVLGRDVIRELAENAESEQVRLSAAKTLLERGVPMEKDRRGNTYNFFMTPEERRERIKELQKEMGLEAKTIDAEFTEIKEPGRAGVVEPFDLVLPAPDTPAPETATDD
jgi:hypothetical protein